MDEYQELTINEWLYVAQETGRIRFFETVFLAARLDECEAAAWIADIVFERVSEHDALLFLRRAAQQQHQGM